MINKGWDPPSFSGSVNIFGADGISLGGDHFICNLF